MLIIDQLINKIDETSCPVVVGLDPLIEKIPSFIKDNAVKAYGNTPQAAAEALYLFNESLLRRLSTQIPAVKLQMACYELYGKWGLDAFERTVALAKELGLIVIDDSKRNDIGSTARLYALSHLGNAPLIEGEGDLNPVDFLTVNPYLGSDSITPFVTQCQTTNKGLFVLVRTSNPSANEYQEAVVGEHRLYEKIALDLQEIAQSSIGSRQYSPFGAVVGATWTEEIRHLRNLMPNVFFLVPGYGAQGGTADQVSGAFGEDGYGAVINSSRGIIFAQQQPEYQEAFPHEESFAEASQKALLLMRDALLRSLKQAGKLPKNW